MQISKGDIMEKFEIKTHSKRITPSKKSVGTLEFKIIKTTLKKRVNVKLNGKIEGTWCISDFLAVKQAIIQKIDETNAEIFKQAVTK